MSLAHHQLLTSIRNDCVDVLRRQNPTWEIKDIERTEELDDEFGAFLASEYPDNASALDRAIKERMNSFRDELVIFYDLKDGSEVHAAIYNNRKNSLRDIIAAIYNYHINMLKL